VGGHDDVVEIGVGCPDVDRVLEVTLGNHHVSSVGLIVNLADISLLVHVSACED